MKSTILPSVVAVALALSAIGAAAQVVPTFDVGSQCRSEAKAAPGLAESCLADEKKAREDLVRQWAQFAPASKAKCIEMSNSVAGIQSYVELLTCLQIDRDVKNLPKR